MQLFVSHLKTKNVNFSGMQLQLFKRNSFSITLSAKIHLVFLQIAAYVFSLFN